MSVDYLSALNIGSGLNTTELVDSLVEAEGAPQKSRIDKQRSRRTVEISGLAQVKQGMTSLETGVAGFDGKTGLAVTSTTSSVTASIHNAALAGSFSHNLEVDQLASKQVLVFDGFSDETDAVGTGSLTFSFGSWETDGSFSANADLNNVTIDITEENNSLAGLVDAINSADMNVTASLLLADGATYSLVLTSREGADHAMHISTSEDASNPGLATFNYDAVDATVETVSGADAILKLDGQTITRSQNEITDLIDGINLTLQGTTSSTERIVGSFSEDSALTAMNGIIDEMNSLHELLGTLAKRDITGDDDGPLAGDPLVRSMQNQLRSMTTKPIVGFADDAIYLAEFGVRTERDGTISLDEDAFRSAFELDPDRFAAITNSRITSSSGLVKPSVLTVDPPAGVYSFVIEDDLSATLADTDMNVSGSRYSIADGDMRGLVIDITNNGADASIYVGVSLVDELISFADEMLANNSDLGRKMDRYNDDLVTYDEDQQKLDERLENIRERYQIQFATMEAAVTSLNRTGESITNMMDAWRASLKE